jgi:hypothetical protein
MYHKVLVFMNEAGEKKRVYIRDGAVRNKAVMELATANGFHCENVVVKGDPLFQPALRFKDKREKVRVEVPAEFLGLQTAAKVTAPAPVEHDETGAVIPPVEKKRGKKSSITPEILENIKKEAEAGKTMTEASEALGIPYPTLAFTAKKNGIAFVKGKKGKKGKKKSAGASAVNVDLDAVRVQHALGGTMMDAAAALGVGYPLIVKAAKLLDLKFAPGKRGRQKGWKKAV